MTIETPHLWIPRRTFIEVAPYGIGLAKSRMQGFYKMVGVKADGSGRSRVLADWFPNLITNGGLERVGTASGMGRIHVGTSNTAPAVTDTALGGWVASDPATEDSTSCEATPPYFGTRTMYCRFDPGVATGNLAEVGMGWSATNDSMFSRALILDGGGSPTVISLLADEYLDVYYQLRMYPGFLNSDGTPNDGTFLAVPITNVGTRDVTARCASVTSTLYWTDPGDLVGLRLTDDCTAFTGTLGAVTTIPSGVIANNSVSSLVANTYVSSSLERTFTNTWGLNGANGTIKSVDFPTSYGRYQFEFDTTFAKTNLQTLVLNFTLSWDRV